MVFRVRLWPEIRSITVNKWMLTDRSKYTLIGLMALDALSPLPVPLNVYQETYIVTFAIADNKNLEKIVQIESKSCLW